MIELPAQLAVAIFAASAVLGALALFGYQRIEYKGLKLGPLPIPTRVTAGILAVLLFGFSIATFVNPPVAGPGVEVQQQPTYPTGDPPEHTYARVPREMSPWLDVDSNSFTFGEADCSLADALAAESGRPTAKAITFNLSQGGYCGWGIRLNGYDATGTATLTFWVKGRVGGEQFEVGIRDATTRAGAEPKVARVARADWRLVSIELWRFGGQDLSSLDNVSFGFDIAFAAGTIYIDKVAFK